VKQDFFSEKLIVAQLVKKFLIFREPAGLLLYSQEFTTGPCPELTEFIPQVPAYLLKMQINIIFPSMLRFSSGLFLSSFLTTTCVQIYLFLKLM
jgi:hypothetical protein